MMVGIRLTKKGEKTHFVMLCSALDIVCSVVQNKLTGLLRQLLLPFVIL